MRNSVVMEEKETIPHNYVDLSNTLNAPSYM